MIWVVIAVLYGTNGAAGRLPGTFGLAAAELTRLSRAGTCPGCGRPDGIWCAPSCEYAKDTE